MGDILIDGYNVIRNNDMYRLLEERNSEAARHMLVQHLINKYRVSEERVTVVFDGDGAYEQVSHHTHIKVIYSHAGEKADSVIMRLAAEARGEGRAVSMYSNDEEVRQSVTEQGGQALFTRTLTQHLNAAPRDVAIRSAHRQQARRVYGVDPSKKGEYDDYYSASNASPGKRKKKSPRRYK
jgi:predicted RNA-binding protein with PIN domain